MQTQAEAARAGTLTPQMETVARAERVEPGAIRDLVAAGRVVIPANPAHGRLRPIGIGRALRVKINANIGNSSLSGGLEGEIEKLEWAVRCGADTVMDLSTGPNLTEIRAALIERAAVPLGTVPIYEAAAGVERPEDLDPDRVFAVIRDQAAQGVDYMTVHAGLLRAHAPLAARRRLGIVSRGGALLARWMDARDRENFLFERFDELLAVCRAHDVTLSLGDGLRPGCLADATDEAQLAELRTLGELVRRCRAAGVQAMVEGPGHVPLDQIERNMAMERELCDDAPFYVLGPVVVDCAPGYDHLTAAIGGALGAYHGAAMLCYVTPKEHLGLPNARDVREGVVAFRIAAHAADVALGKPGARDRDDEVSEARAAFDWERQFDLALDPGRARDLRREALAEAGQPFGAPDACGQTPDFCSMCGPQFCSMRLHRAMRDAPPPAAARS